MNGKWKILLGGGIGMLFLLLAVNGAYVQAKPAFQAYDCSAQTAIPSDQCDALVAIYEATNGDNWVENNGWLDNPDPCQWYGVSCHEGAVVALDLYGNRLEGTLPLEIGGFPELQTLTINDNLLSGPIPLTITFMNLVLFHFHNTSLCEPADPNFQDWLSQIVYRISTDESCSPPVPTDTPAPLVTQSPTSTSDVPWPEQTLTALAQEATREAIIALTAGPTATRYYTLETPTATSAMVDQDAGNGGQSEGASEGLASTTQPSVGVLRNFFSGISGIPRGWLLLLLVPVALIIVGVLLELRDRRIEKENRPEPPRLEFIDYEE